MSEAQLRHMIEHLARLVALSCGIGLMSWVVLLTFGKLVHPVAAICVALLVVCCVDEVRTWSRWWNGRRGTR